MTKRFAIGWSWFLFLIIVGMMAWTFYDNYEKFIGMCKLFGGLSVFTLLAMISGEASWRLDPMNPKNKGHN